MKYDNKDLAYIDKHYGERFAKFCRSNFPEILEHEGVLQEIITNTFAPTKSLYEDIVKNNSQEQFKSFIFSIYRNEYLKNIEELKVITKTPEELMDEAGYILYPECKTEKDIQAFRKYYYRSTPLAKDVENAERLETRQGEELCTFNGGRLNSARVWFAVKKDAVDLNNPYYKRENWKEPKRQDDYGTSVISIQFDRSSGWLSIKNRYNHTVANPDSTFSNDLENIRAGLTDAFKETYDINIENQKSNSFDLTNYVRASDGKFYRYNMEIDNVYYCENNIIVNNGRVEQLNQSEYILIDEYVLDLKNKKFLKNSAFAQSVGEIDNIEILNNREKKTRTILITPQGEGKKVEIEINIHNQIVGYKNPNVTKIGNDFLRKNKSLTSIELPLLQTVGNNFLYNNETLTSLNLPNLQSVEYDFLYSNEVLTSLNLPLLQSVGYDFLYHNKVLTSLNLPKLQFVGDDFLYSNEVLTSLNLPLLQFVGGSFLYSNEVLTSLNLPLLQSERYDFLCHNKVLTSLNLPKLQSVGDNFLYSNEVLTSLNLPLLQYAGNEFLRKNNSLTYFNLPLLEDKKIIDELNNIVDNNTEEEMGI